MSVLGVSCREVFVRVTKALGAAAVEVVGYQVIVEKDVEQVHPSGFYKPVLSVYLELAETTRSTV